MALLAVIAVSFLASMFMAWTIGANSNSAPFAPAVGANAIPVMRAALFVGIFASLGAVLQGASISETVGKELIRGVTITPLAAASGLLTAAAFITIGNRRGYPVPAAFTVTGAMIGVGLALNGAPATSKYIEIALFWLVIPFVGSGIGLTTATLLRRDDVPETVAVPLLAGVVGITVSNMRLAFLPSGSNDQGTLAGYVSRSVDVGSPSLAGFDLVLLLTSLGVGVLFFVVMRRSVKRSVESGVKTFLIVLGSLVVFSSGGSQVGLATGPLETLFETDLGLPSLYLLLIGGVSILFGAWMGAPRVVQAVSREYSRLGVRRSISALVPAFIIAQSAIYLGLPVSTNETIISSLIGSGLVEGSSGISGRKIGYTVAVWLSSLVSAGFFSFGLYRVLFTIIGG